MPPPESGRAGVRRERSGPDRPGRANVNEIQRARMLAAAVEVVAERGVANVTVAHIVARSGVSRRTFYECFADREACVLAAFDASVTRISHEVIAAYAREGRWRVRIRAALATLLELLDDDPDAGRFVLVEALGAGADALRHRARVVAGLIAAVDAGRAEARRGSEPSPLIAEGVVGAVLSVLHARLIELPARPAGRSAGPQPQGQFTALLNPLMGMVVLPYLGQAAAERESRAPAPPARATHVGAPRGFDPLRDLDMRLTYRTVRVLVAIAQNPGASNRAVGVAAGIGDQGQVSKLLTRLANLGLVQNAGAGAPKGAANAWELTPKGREVEHAIAAQTARGAGGAHHSGSVYR